MNEDFLLFPWRLPPVLTGLFFFAATVGVVQLLSVLFEGGFLRTRWTTFWLGDPLLACFAVFAGIVIGGDTTRDFQTDWWFQLLLLAVGFAIFVGLELFHVFVDGGPEYKTVAIQPSQLWHTIVAGFVFYEMAWGLITTVRDRNPSWAFVLAMIFFAGYVGTLVYDNAFNPQRTIPVTLNNR